MATVNFDTTRALTSDELKMIDNRFGLEVIADMDDFEDGHNFWNYFLGRDDNICDCEKCEECDDCKTCDCDCECDEDVLSTQDAYEACNWLRNQSGLPITLTAVR